MAPEGAKTSVGAQTTLFLTPFPASSLQTEYMLVEFRSVTRRFHGPVLLGADQRPARVVESQRMPLQKPSSVAE